MAIHDSSFPKNTAIDSITTERIRSFIHICLVQEENSPAKKYSDYDGTSYANYLAKNKLLDDQLKSYIRNKILPDDLFQWITNNNYQHCWIKEKAGIIEKSEYNIEYTERGNKPWNVVMHIPVDLEIKTCSMAIIDYLYFMSIHYNLRPFYSPLHTIKELGKFWLIQQKDDKVFEWINNSDTESKIVFFREWLQGKISQPLPSTSSINTYEQLLIYFLRSNFSTIEKNALNSNARKIWNQKKAREEAKDSKQYNFILRNETIKKLDELAKKYYLSRSEIIESIIESEYKNRVHIEEKINRRKQIKHPSSD